MRVESVYIDKIVIPRELEANDDLSELVASIRHLDLKIPVLVDENYHLIDGLRRIAVFRDMGRTVIPCVKSKVFDESVAQLHKAHKHGVAERDLTPRRMAALMDALGEQIAQRSHWARVRRTGLPKDMWKIGSSREILKDAVGAPAEAWISGSDYVYTMARQDSPQGEFAAEIVAQLEAGEFGLYRAATRVREFANKTKNRLNEQDQRRLLDGIVQQLNGIVRAMGMVGELDVGLADEELLNWENQLRESKRVIHNLQNRLKKEREERSND